MTEDKSISLEEEIIKKLSWKAGIKQLVYKNTYYAFRQFNDVLRKLSLEIKTKMSKINKDIVVEYSEKGNFEVHFKFAGDVLIFMMHTNVFEFPKAHEIFRTGYLREDKTRSYCGVINVYNFLSDSFKYNRINDIGYLVARIFINKENHFFVEGKRQMAMIYNNFASKEINQEEIKNIIGNAILYSIDFDLLVPYYDDVSQISVQEVFDNSNYFKIKTGKRLGFQFNADHQSKSESPDISHLGLE